MIVPAHIEVTIAPAGTRIDCHECGMRYVDRLGVDPQALIDTFVALHGHGIARNAPVPAPRQGPQRRPGLDWHSGTPEPRKARKSANSDADTTGVSDRREP